MQFGSLVGNRLEGRGGAVQKGLFFDEIAGRITGQGKFGKSYDVRARLFAATRKVENLSGIGFEIAHRIVDLGQGDSHWNSHCIGEGILVNARSLGHV